MGPFPVRRITFTTPAEERERLVGEGLDHETREIARMTRNARGTFAPFADFRAFRDSEQEPQEQCKFAAGILQALLLFRKGALTAGDIVAYIGLLGSLR